MALSPRFLRRRRRQPKGGTTQRSTFFNPASSQSAAAPGELFFASAFVQTKLTVNQPGDAHEQEADKMAEHVVQRTAMKPDEEKIQRRAKHEDEKCQCKADSADEKMQKKEMHEEEKPIQKKDTKEDEKPVQAKASGVAGPAAAPVSAHHLNGTKGQGSPLPTTALAEMSQAFGHDFSPVRIHTTTQAEQLSQNLHAQAFTHGNDVYFNAGKYNPETTDGKRLLAHELTHVVQQGQGEPLAVQRYPVPGQLACTDVVPWIRTNSPYAPEWAETRCDYAFSDVPVKIKTFANGTAKATASGSSQLSVTKRAPIDSPDWKPAARPNQAAEQAAWNTMKQTLMAHEHRHRDIGEQERVRMQSQLQAVQLVASGSSEADAVQQVQQQLVDLQQQWIQHAQAAQDAIDPFRGAVLNCP